MILHLNKVTFTYIHKYNFVSDFVEIGPVVLEKEILKSVNLIFFSD